MLKTRLSVFIFVNNASLYTHSNWIFGAAQVVRAPGVYIEVNEQQSTKNRRFIAKIGDFKQALKKHDYCEQYLTADKIYSFN